MSPTTDRISELYCNSSRLAQEMESHARKMEGGLRTAISELDRVDNGKDGQPLVSHNLTIYLRQLLDFIPTDTQAQPNDGGPAFPFACQGPTTAPEIYYGMSLRDWFAGQALTLFPLNDGNLIDLVSGVTPRHDVVAKFCYQLADAMLAAREAKS